MFQSTRLVSLLCVVVVVLAFSITAHAEIPQYISYQGKITDSGGTPVADGTYTMRFRIYNAASGGSLLWDSNNQSVTVSQGVANVVLGESPQPALGLDFSADYWLLVTFAGVDQSPRVRLTSAGYSYMASGLVPGTEVIGSVGTGAVITGTNTSTIGFGVRGSGAQIGVSGLSTYASGMGIVGTAAATTGQGVGVKGQSDAAAGMGVWAIAAGTSGYNYGVYAVSYSPSGYGVYGVANASSGVNYGVYGSTNSPSGYAGYFAGNTQVTGNLTVNGTVTGIGSNSNPILKGENVGSGYGVVGIAYATTGSTFGGSFQSYSTSGSGVFALASASYGTTNGVYGQSLSTMGRGVFGSASATSGPNCGVYGESNSSEGYGVYGIATATTGDADGGNFKTSAPNGRGIYALASATSGSAYGVHGVSTSTSGVGVFGSANASSGFAYGVMGHCESTSGRGVFGLGFTTFGINYGVYGQSNSTSGRGVHGSAFASSGVNYGVYGSTNSPSGYAGYFSGNARVTGNLTVDGTLTGSGIGDITAVNAGTGLDGGGTSGSVTLNVEVPLTLTGSSSNPILKGVNAGSSDGIWGETSSTSGTGVYGYATASSGYTFGVFGRSNSTSGHGVYGWAQGSSGYTHGGYFTSVSSLGTGVYGEANPASTADRIGVYGKCTPADYYGIGVKGEGYYEGVLGICNASGSAGGSYYGSRGEAIVSGVTGTAYGVYGYASGAGTHYGVYYSGGIGGSSTMKNTVRTEEGPVELYGHLTTENWFEDFGTGTIRGGQAVVPLADDYLQTVSIGTDNPMKVFITPKARIGEWWVEDGLDQFTLFAPDAPEGATFDYRVVAKRPGYETTRLETATAGYTDRFLYPDINDVPTAHRTEWLKAEAVKQETAHDPAMDR